MSIDQNYWPSPEGLRTGHLNINHVFNKITDVTTIISNSGKQFHLFGFSESCLTEKIPSSVIFIPDNTIVSCKDAITNNFSSSSWRLQATQSMAAWETNDVVFSSSCL